MDQALRRLMKRFLPPSHPPYADVDWERIEGILGLKYPSHFKEFFASYGGSIWFDNVSPFCWTPELEAPKAFLKRVEMNLEPLKTNLYDEEFRRIELPLYPEPGGLFPFLADFNSNLFCWRTEREDPNKWPVVFWNRGPVFVKEKLTVAKMILDWLDHKSHMVKVWGDVRLYEPERIRLTDPSEPKKGDKKRRMGGWRCERPVNGPENGVTLACRQRSRPRRWLQEAKNSRNC